jgi:hypothetical protein
VQAALIAALAFLARSITLHWLGKELELHKARIAADAQLAVEEFKGELSMHALEHQVRFQALHANQVAAIEALYVKLVEIRYLVETFVHAWRADNQEECFLLESFRTVGIALVLRLPIGSCWSSSFQPWRVRTDSLAVRRTEGGTPPQERRSRCCHSVGMDRSEA